MSKIAVMGDYDSIYGFATLGLDTFPVNETEEAAKLLKRLSANEYGIIYITEELAASLDKEIKVYADVPVPAIIQIPGIKGNTGAGINGVKKSVEQAVGSDILFGGVSSEEGETK
ncbi:MAG: V-type ATP synthase subunit F [Lachnospiraceae bacterium]|nr:V-type ATP synthase subunit F [Candidatus Equihabitans merdae]